MKPQTISIKNGENTTVYGMIIQNVSAGHDISESGEDSSFVSLKVAHGSNYLQRNIYKGDIVTFETYLIQVEGMSDDDVTLLVSDGTGIPIALPERVTIKNGEKILVMDLQITFLPSGRRIMEDGSDPSLFSLSLKTSQIPEERIHISFNSTKKSENKDIHFGDYSIEVVDVDFYGDFIILIVSKLEGVVSNS